MDSLESKVGQGKVLHISESIGTEAKYVLFRSENEFEPYDTIRNDQWSDMVRDVTVVELQLTEKGSDKDLVLSQSGLYGIFKKDQN
jgi:hypothetical protein